MIGWHRHGCFALFLSFLIAAGCSRTPTLGEEIKLFQGGWRVVDTGQAGYRSVRVEKDFFEIFEFKNGNLKLIEKYQLSVDPGPSPAQIDLVLLHGDNVGRTRSGIFAFEGKKLKICLAEGDAKRPTEFAATQSSVLLVLERPAAVGESAKP